ncbi:MAG: hypothetical protein AB1571_03495 [Nanoarchaeota archaeon]
MIAETANIITSILMAFGIVATAIKRDFSIALILTVLFLIVLFLFM